MGWTEGGDRWGGQREGIGGVGDRWGGQREGIGWGIDGVDRGRG